MARGTTKLANLAVELESNCGSGNVYAAHAVLRATLDHTPPLFGQKSFDSVASNCQGRTDKKYLQQLEHFRSQGDDALHRQIGRSPCLLSIEDPPARAAINRYFATCADKLEASAPTP
jgi:hypothetical protein